MKKKHPEHVNLERWLVSYADFITLLFAFFVVMYAISQADLAKFKDVSASLKAAFSSAGPVSMIDLGGNAGGDTVNVLQDDKPSQGRVMNMPAGKTNTASESDPDLVTLKEKLEESVSFELGVSDVSENMQMYYDSRGLVVRLAAKDFFDHGAVSIHPDLMPLLDRIGRVISKSNRLIRVEGHSDPSEKDSFGYHSSWEFTAARAAYAVKYWLRRFPLDPKRISVAGMSHYRPVSQGKTKMDRAANRRIEIIILNNKYAQ